MAIEPVSGSPTRAQFRSILRAGLPDRSLYPDYLIDQWIADGIREYSSNFPYRTWGVIMCDPGVRFYLLNDVLSLNAIIDVTAIEYPTGQVPRRFLSRLDEHSEGFVGSPVYDVGSQDETISYLYGTPQLYYIVLGETPAAGDSIWIEYETVHLVPTSDSIVISVPEHHLEIIRLYTMWRAAEFVETSEASGVDRKNITDLRMRTERAAGYYRTKVKEALAANVGKIAPVRWSMPGVGGDRVY